MMDCRDTKDRLAPYVDGALAARERVELEQHLDRCVACRRAATEAQGARTLLRARADALRTVVLPTGLRTRLEALAREQTAPRPGWRARLVPMSLTAVLVLFSVFAVFFLATRRESTLFAGRLTADLVRCVKEAGGPETASADAGRLESLLSEQYGWKVRVPPSSSAGGVELVGARRCLYADGSVPHVLYRTSDGDVSLYMMEGVMRGEADVVTEGYRSRVWSRGATTFVLVAPVEAGDLAGAVEYLKQEAY